MPSTLYTYPCRYFTSRLKSQISKKKKNGNSFIIMILRVSGNVKYLLKPLLLTLEPPDYTHEMEKTPNGFLRLLFLKSQNFENWNTHGLGRYVEGQWRVPYLKIKSALRVFVSVCVPWCESYKVSKIQNSFCYLLEDVDPILPNLHFMF